MTATPEISVIVPMYNTADWILRCLSSLQDQAFEDFEAIVVDDGSTDDGALIAQGVAARDDRFRVIQTENRGLSSARNIALDQARGEFVAFVDSDDRVHVDYLSTLRSALVETGADWACCPVELEYMDMEDTHVTRHSALHSQPEYEQSEQVELILFESWLQVIDHWPSAWNKLYRRSLIADVRFEEDLAYEDLVLFLKLARRSLRIARVQKPLYCWQRSRPGQITADGGERVFEQIQVLDQVRQVLQQDDSQAAPRLSHAFEAFERSVGRLLYERDIALQDLHRKHRFHRACRDYFLRHGLSFNPGKDPFIPAIWGVSVSNPAPISFILYATGNEEALEKTLSAIARQHLPDFETVIISPTPIEKHPDYRIKSVISVAGPLDMALAQQKAIRVTEGRYVAFINAGDRPDPDGFARLAGQLEEKGAQFGVGVCHRDVSDGSEDVHLIKADGLSSLDPTLSGKLFRRDLLEKVPAGPGWGHIENAAYCYALAARGLPGLLVEYPLTTARQSAQDQSATSYPWLLKNYLGRSLDSRGLLENRLRLMLMLRGVWEMFQAPGTSELTRILLCLQVRILFWWYGFNDTSIATEEMSEDFLQKVGLNTTGKKK